MNTVCFFLVGVAYVSASGDWGYHGDNGPSTWAAHHEHCAGTAQSPIDVQSSETSPKQLAPFHLKHYRRDTGEMTNNGHSVQINLKGNKKPTVSGAGLPTTYIADQFHFHWGSENSQGSEHTVNGKAYPMEMHIVHHSSEYPNISAAASESRGLVVLAVLFEIGEYNDRFDTVLGGLGEVEDQGDTTDIGKFNLRKLMPEDLSSYWRYSGSLTTPPCYESVIWTVFQNPVEISQDQIEEFRDISGLSDNFRPTQPLNGRTVISAQSLRRRRRGQVGGA